MRNQLKIRGGVIHKVDSGFVISDVGGWLAGNYDSIDSAKLAIKNKSKNNWSYLGELQEKINVGLGRSITTEDFK